MYLQREPPIKRRQWAVFPWRPFGVRWTRALMQHSPNSTPDTTRECARIRDVWIVIKGTYLYKRGGGERRVRPGPSSEFPVATSIGAAVTRLKERSFTRKRQGSSLARQRSRGTSRIFCRGKSSSKQSEQEKRRSKRERLLRLDLRKKGG
jgi:hypothetical protein